MNLDGTFTFSGPRLTVWELLQDPAVLAKALPGTERLELSAPDHFHGVMKVSVGPVTAASFDVAVTLTEKVPPDRFALQIEGKGGVGHTRGTAHIELSDAADGGTVMHVHLERPGRRKDCRCRPAIARVGWTLDDEAGAGLAGTGAARTARGEGWSGVKPAAFEYYAPSTLDDALVLLGEHGSDAKPLAGGQSLIPAMNFRLATPAVLVDLNGLDELSFISADGAGLHLGGMTRHRALELSPAVASHAPLVAAAMPFVAHLAIRTRGTIGGSLAHADPAAELPAVMVALDASVRLRSRAGSRVVPAAGFFTGLFATAIEPGELLVGVDIPPVQPRTAFAFDEISRRRGDFALAGAAARVTVGADGVCTALRVALLSVADQPVLAAQAARALVGTRPSPKAIRDAAEASARTDIDPTTDIHASSRYRRRLAAVLIRRVLERAFLALESV